MANAKKKKTTTRKTNATKKTNNTTKTKKTTRNSSTSVSNKTTKKITTATKKTTTKTAPKKSTAKKTSTTKKSVVEAIEPATVETAALPKLKATTREVSKNKNVANKVIKEEKFTGVKNAQKQIKGKRKSKENIVTLIKSHPFLQKVSKIKRKIRMYGITSVIPKKYIIVTCFLLLFMVILPTSVYFYQAPSAKMDLSSVEQIDTLKTLSLNLDSIDDIINKTNAFNSLKNYDRYDFETVFKLNSDYVDQFVIKYNESKKQLLFIIKPTSNNYDNVKSTMNKFLKENKISNYINFDYDGYIIYIKAKNKTEERDYNLEVKSKIMQSTISVFDLLLDLKKDDIEQTMKIPSNLYSEAVIKVARLKSDTCGYAIIKPTSMHAKNKIESLMNEYYKSLEEKWANDPKNLELVKNRYFEEYQGYLIYIISNNNKLVMELIKSK